MSKIYSVGEKANRNVDVDSISSMTDSRIPTVRRLSDHTAYTQVTSVTLITLARYSKFLDKISSSSSTQTGLVQQRTTCLIRITQENHDPLFPDEADLRRASILSKHLLEDLARPTNPRPSTSRRETNLYTGLGRLIWPNTWLTSMTYQLTTRKTRCYWFDLTIYD